MYNKRLLLNAEPFGFGPTAAIASFYPHLKKHFDTISYIGEGHTLDLQKQYDYNQIYDLTGLTQQKKETLLQTLSQDYDIFLSAMDFGMAKTMHTHGMTIAIYDALTRYRKNPSGIIKDCDLYIAQNFCGVQDKLNNTQTRGKNHVIVPPIIPTPIGSTTPSSRSKTLINLGGLHNPLWSLKDTAQYAKSILDSILNTLADYQDVVITTSKSVGKELTEYPIQTLSRERMIDILTDTKLAFMTPGLGNIYDAAGFDIPTVRLPPANDSQGQQLTLLKQSNMVDADLDWNSIGFPINYFGKQPDVIASITQAVDTIDKETLTLQFGKAIKNVESISSTKTASLIEQFGTGGAEIVAKHVYSLRMR